MPAVICFMALCPAAGPDRLRQQPPARCAAGSCRCPSAAAASAAACSAAAAAHAAADVVAAAGGPSASPPGGPSTGTAPAGSWPPGASQTPPAAPAMPAEARSPPVNQGTAHVHHSKGDEKFRSSLHLKCGSHHRLCIHCMMHGMPNTSAHSTQEDSEEPRT